MKKKYGIAMKFYRLERFMYCKGMERFAKVIYGLIYILFSCSIPPSAILEEEVEIEHSIGIVIHQNSIIGKGTKIYQNVTIGGGRGPKIGENCVIGSGAIVLGSINIGNDVKIGANAVVLNDVPNNCTVVGVPAKIVKSV